MEELTESARQCLVSQGIVIGTLSVLNSLGLLLTGIVVITRATDILHFTSLTHLAVLEIVCGISSLLAVFYIWWIVAAYRNRQLEVRSKYLDENMSRALLILILPLIVTFSALIVSGVFLMLKIDSSSSYDLKSAMSLYSTDFTRKVIMDQLQILLQCCGSQSLLDWFLIDWQNEDLEPGEHIQNNSLTDWDSVPFSCCCIEAPPPCIHHQLRAFGVGSLYTVGCADKLDEAVFIFVVLALIMFFCSTFLMLFLMYSSRKLQTSARSAIHKGDATAPGTWWILSPADGDHSSQACESNDRTPLLDDKKSLEHNRRNESLSVCLDEKNKSKKHKGSGSLFSEGVNKSKGCHRNDGSISMMDVWSKRTRMNVNPVLMMQKSKIIDSTINDDWETYKSGSKNFYEDSSEDWTRRAYDASGSTSTTSFLTTSVPVNSTPESRHSVSDTAVANLEVSHHFEHKIRPLYRS